jgi:predicted dehydrogenase
MKAISRTARTSRRSFLKSATAAGLCTGPLQSISHAASPNGKIQHAAIGVGGMGWGDLNQIASHPNTEIVAVCDIDKRRAAKAVAKFPNARVYQDWRELLDKEGDKVDSVNVTVPDHMHAPITMSALNLGKHVYCQKPLTHNLYEARQITAAAKRAGVVTQMGIQLSSTIASRMATGMIQQGAIGKVNKAYLWSNKDTSRYRPKGPRPDRTDPVPAELNWDGWCGVAPVRPYVQGVYHPTWWRGWQDFGCGWLGDMGCHIMDMPYRALRIGMPVAVHAEVEPAWRDDPARRAETFPTWQIVRYTYPGTEMTAGDTIDIIWSDGYKYPPADLTKLIDGHKYPSQGAMLIGENGTMLMPHGDGPRFFPTEKLKSLPRPKLKPLNHYHQFVDKILGKADATVQAAFDYAGPLTEMILLGTVALRFPDRSLNWNAREMKITNEPGADGFVRRTYRNEWKVKGL